MNIIYITEIQIAWCAIDTNFILHNTLHLNLTLDNTNYITNSLLIHLQRIIPQRNERKLFEKNSKVNLDTFS